MAEKPWEKYAKSIGAPGPWNKYSDQQLQEQTVPPYPRYDLGKATFQGGGAMIGSSVGGIIAGPPGSIAGGAAGAYIGEKARQSYNEMQGVKDERTPAERTEDELWAAGTGGATEVLGLGAGKLIRAGTKAFFRGGRPPSAVQQQIRNFGRAGASPTLGEATGSYAWQFIESSLSKTPGPHGVLMRKLDETAGRFHNFFKQRAEWVGGPGLDPEMAGATARTGIENWRTSFTNEGAKLEQEFTKFLDPATPRPANNYKGALEEFTSVDPAAPNVTGRLVSPTERAMLDDIVKDLDPLGVGTPQSGGIPVSALIKQRSRVGSLLENFELVSPVNRAHAKKLYQSLSNDIRETMVGNPQALAAFDRRNQHWKDGIQRIDNFLDGMYKKGIEPEKLFESIFRSTKSTTAIRELYDTLSADERDVITGMVIKRMGTPTQAEDSVWDSMRFLRDYENIPNATKDLVFGATGSSILRKDLDTVTAAIAEQREMYKRFGNPPRTASGLIGPAILSGGLASVIGYSIGMESAPGYAFTLGILSLGTAVTAKKLLANPTFVHWLARSTKIKGGPTAITAHIAKLAGLATTSDPENREAILEYIDVARGAITADFLNQQQPPEVPKGQ
jgi:hypothetical protein